MKGVPAPKPPWRTLLPEPFWQNLTALLLLSIITCIPLLAICIVLFPGAKGGDAATFVGICCYLVAVPITWTLFRDRKPPTR